MLYFSYQCVLLVISMTISDGELHSKYFNKIFDNESIKMGNSYRSTVVKSLISCISVCQQDAVCISASYHENGECRLSTVNMDTVATCNICEPYQGSQVYTTASISLCQNGGIYDNGGSCTCFNGYIGQYCEYIMKDCQEGEPYYSNQEGVFLIQPITASTAFPVYCSFTPVVPMTRLYVQRHLYSGSNFSRSWAEYKAGFGDIMTTANNFWLGNQYLHYITTSDIYTFVIEMADQSWAEILQQEYPHVVIGDESLWFKLEVNGVSSTTATGYPTLGDSFSILHGNYFSTYDSDNDQNTLNCAVKLGNGFWFGDINGACTTCNPNGILIESQYNERINIADEVFWDDMAIWSPWHVQIWLERR